MLIDRSSGISPEDLIEPIKGQSHTLSLALLSVVGCTVHVRTLLFMAQSYLLFC